MRTDATRALELLPARQEAARSLRVLLAEEKLLVAMQLKGQVERLGHRVVGVARDGKDAVEAAWSLDPDLMIMDIRLPVIDGIEAARTILRQKAVPIILLTAYLSAGLSPRAREAGIMAHLVKPIQEGQLRSTIKLVLARFEELKTLRREGITLREAFETRALVERAKRVLMKELELSEVEAFQRIHCQKQTMNKGYRETASAIVRADELLVRRLDFTKCLQAIHRAIHPSPRQVFSVTK